MAVLSEWDNRKNRAIQRAMRGANFRHKASIEEIDFSIERGLDRNQVQRLAELSLMVNTRTCLLPDLQGTGKSYLASALGYQTCQKDNNTYLHVFNRQLLGGNLKWPRGAHSLVFPSLNSTYKIYVKKGSKLLDTLTLRTYSYYGSFTAKDILAGKRLDLY